MRISSAVLVASVVFLSAMAPRATYAGVGKIIIKSPDPGCSNGLPSDPSITGINLTPGLDNADGEATAASGTVIGTVDGATPFNDNDFANCTGTTLDVLAIPIVDIPPGETYVVLLSGGTVSNPASFDGSGFMIDSPTSATLFLYCDEAIFQTTCGGLSGVAGTDNGVSVLVNTPEPSATGQLLLGIGGLFLLGFIGRKSVKQVHAGRLA
jgi:hypothetical protein